MKFRAKFSISAIVAGLMALINSCRHHDRLTLLGYRHFPEYSSASALECIGDQLYMAGDDATTLWILDMDFVLRDSIRFHEDTSRRIAKNKKPDFESAAILRNRELYILGSFADDNRKKGIIFPLAHPR